MLAVALGACGPSTVTVVPFSPPPVQDKFFATWEIQSTQFGVIGCIQAYSTTVSMALANLNTGSQFVFTFPCSDFQGTSGVVDVGQFSVQMALLDPANNILSLVTISTENTTVEGTVDVGHIIFTQP